MVEEILQDVDITEDIPPALLEHIIISNANGGPDLRRSMLVSTPYNGTESIDLLTCAASMGNDSVLSALIRAGVIFVLLEQSTCQDRPVVLLIASASTSRALERKH